MNRKPSPPRALSSTLVATVLAATLVGSATAQGCGVRNGFRIVNSHAGGSSELAVDTGWQTTAPLVTPGFNSNPYTGTGCASQGSCTPTSDYGFLSVTGSGAANNSPMGGTFLWLDQAPQARFTDTMVLTSATLPNGTPVQVRAIVTLDGSAVVVDPTPSVSYGVNFAAASIGVAINDAPGTVTGIINTTVGASVPMQASLGVTLYPYGMLGFGNPPFYGSYSVGLTARVGLTCLTPDVSLSFCSGRSYSSFAAAVTAVGGGCGAGSPVMNATLPILGQTQTYSVSSTAANEPVFFAYALGNAVSVPIGPCTVTEDLTSVALLLVGATDGAGSCGFGLSIPATPGLAGAAFTAQAFVLSPGGPMLGFAQLSNGLLVSLGL